LVPQEDKIVQHVLEALGPYSTEQGGPLIVEHLSYVDGRGNVMVTYPGTGRGTVSFVGSHMDVVPANPEKWLRNPFELTREGDKLFGRGTTDCLGHVAMITDMLIGLAEARPSLTRTVAVVFIAAEEGGEEGIGVDAVVAAGKMDALKAGPVVWIDSADSQPCVGTAGAIQWSLKANGHLFHSGLPHRGINAIEFGSEALRKIQNSFYEDFPPHPDEAAYNFATCSTMKPTQMKCCVGSLNQLPPWAEWSGDIRLTPFYEVDDVKAKVESYVAALNEDLASIPTRGPYSKYDIEGGPRGSLELTWVGASLAGVACTLDTPGNKALVGAISDVKGEAKPYAITGSLPLVRDLQKAGFDLQISGFGLSTVYHADNEYCLLSDMKDACKVLLRVIYRMDGVEEEE